MRLFIAALAAGAVAATAGVVLAPVLGPEVRRYARPAAKALMKTGLAAAAAARIYVAELSEDVEDLLAETMAERKQKTEAERAETAKKTRTESQAETQGQSMSTAKPTAKRSRKPAQVKTASRKATPKKTVATV